LRAALTKGGATSSSYCVIIVSLSVGVGKNLILVCPEASI